MNFLKTTVFMIYLKKFDFTWVCGIFFCAFLGFYSSFSFAQIDAGALQQGLQKQLPAPSPLALPEANFKEPVYQKDQQKGAVTFEVKSFVLEGVKILPEAEVQAVLASWINRSVDFDELQRACDAVVELYRKRGYTVQAILPPQKIANGVVKILITEAKLSSVIVESPDGDTRFGKDRAAQYITYANPIGDPLSMRSLERAIIILNETPGVSVSTQLEPGEKDGETALRMQLLETPLAQGKIEANNYGSRSTGANQGVAAININNPTGFGDQAAVNGIYSEGSQYIQGAYSFPMSKDGMRFGVSGSYLEYKNVSNYGAANANGGLGDAWTAGVSLAYPLVREEGANLNATLNYDLKSYMNKNLLTSNVISSYNIKNISAGLAGNYVDAFFHGGVTSGSATIIFGNLDILGTSQQGYGQYTPSSYGIFSFSGNRNQQLVEGGETSLYFSVSGQAATANLNSAQQFYLGGPYGVRAYPVAQGGGAQGGIATLELHQQFPEQITGSIFFDAGVVQQYINPYSGWQGLTNANNRYNLMGAGFGAKWNYEGWNLGAMVAWKVGANPLYSSTGQAVNTDGTTTNPRGWVTANYQF